MKRGLRVYCYLIAIFVFFLLIAYFVKGRGMSNDLINTILAISSFIFGVILAFSIANRHSRLSNIRSSLRQQDAIFIDLYLLSKTFGSKVFKRVRQYLDGILISQIDYKLEDFYIESPKKVRELCIFIEKLKSKNQAQEEAMDKMLDCINEALHLQKEVEYEVRNKMMFYEWISSLILGFIIIFCLFYVNDNSIVSVIVIPLLSSSLFLLLFVLKDLDTLKFQEQNWIWDPLSQLFLELDLLPYFPESVFEKNRLELEDFKELKQARIAHYPKPYPDMRGKKVKIVQL